MLDEQAVKPDRFNQVKHFTLVQMESALCVWEHILEHREQEPYKSLLADHGYGAMRFCATQAGDICDRAYKKMKELGYEFTVSYDWEFVPQILALIDWNKLFADYQHNGPVYDPDLTEMLAVLIARDKSIQPKPEARTFQKKPDTVLETWLEEARAAAEKLWRYAGLIDDHIERAEASFKEGENPYEFASWLGEKYDLIPAPTW